jgi:Uma2 family endonuclease
MSEHARIYRARYGDLEKMPPHVTAEIVNGELYMHAQPVEPHGNVIDGMIETLRPPFMRGRGGPGGWWIRSEPQISFNDADWRTMVPDLAGWRKERVPELPEKYFDVRPDWICEVLSPSTRLYDRNVKGPAYAEEGIPHFWIIDPAYQTLECHDNVDGAWVERARFEGTTIIATPPFDAVPFDLADLWPPE